MRNVLGILLTAMAALGLHPIAVAGSLAEPSFVADLTPPRYVLYGFEDVDGKRVLEKVVIHTPFNDLMGCITYALQLPMPKPYKVDAAGHKIVQGWTCKVVEMTPEVGT